MKRLDAWSGRRGPLALLYFRLVPGAPFTSVNYAAGMTSLPALHFLIATGAGIVPYTVALAALGGSLTQLRSDQLAGILGAVVALAIAAPTSIARYAAVGPLGAPELVAILACQSRLGHSFVPS